MSRFITVNRHMKVNKDLIEAVMTNEGRVVASVFHVERIKFRIEDHSEVGVFTTTPKGISNELVQRIDSMNLKTGFYMHQTLKPCQYSDKIMIQGDGIVSKPVAMIHMRSGTIHEKHFDSSHALATFVDRF